jgi:hypothetical protein
VINREHAKQTTPPQFANPVPAKLRFDRRQETSKKTQAGTIPLLGLTFSAAQLSNTRATGEFRP